MIAMEIVVIMGRNEDRMQITCYYVQFTQSKFVTKQSVVEQKGAGEGFGQLLGYSDVFTVADSFKCLLADFSLVYWANSLRVLLKPRFQKNQQAFLS